MRRIPDLVTGILLCAAIGAAAWGMQQVEVRWIARPYVESLVLAILLGTVIRTAWTPSPGFGPGIAFTAKELLEVAIVLLGVSVDAQLLLKTGPVLLVGIVVIVAISLCASYGIGRAMGLNHRLAILVSCGNSICGNSAIVAIAPVIGADADDIASAIAFTAVLGVLVVLTLPALPRVSAISDSQYGVIAGLTVYAVPQVLAATFPVSAVAGNMGTLVKLVRVLLLGPVALILGLQHRGRTTTGAVQSRRLVPWFIIGFFVLASVRSLGGIPDGAVAITRSAATVLTIGAMAALGLGVDVRAVRKAGTRVIITVIASLGLLLGMSWELARFLPGA